MEMTIREDALMAAAEIAIMLEAPILLVQASNVQGVLAGELNELLDMLEKNKTAANKLLYDIIVRQE